MRISNNRDLEEAYKDVLWKGFSMREVGYIVLSVGIICAVAVGFWYFFNLPITACAYIGIPFGIPTIIIGFKEFQGLTLLGYLKELKYENDIRELYYDADEMPEPNYYFSMQHEKKKRGIRK